MTEQRIDFADLDPYRDVCDKYAASEYRIRAVIHQLRIDRRQMKPLVEKKRALWAAIREKYGIPEGANVVIHADGLWEAREDARPALPSSAFLVDDEGPLTQREPKP
jgi:hypothetical protein